MVEVLSLKASLIGIFVLFKISVTKCDFLVDLETGRETEREPDFAKRTKEWEVLLKKPFLDAERLAMFDMFFKPVSFLKRFNLWRT